MNHQEVIEYLEKLMADAAESANEFQKGKDYNAKYPYQVGYLESGLRHLTKIIHLKPFNHEF